MRMKTSKGTWTIYGINLTPSDSIYQKIKDAIENDCLTEEYLQEVTGHRSPIIIDMQERTINFSKF